MSNSDGLKPTSVAVPFDITQFVAMQQQVMQVLSSILTQYGLQLELDRIDIEPQDCGGECIDFVYRLKCTSDVVCFYLKEAIKKQFAGAGDGRGEEEEGR